MRECLFVSDLHGRTDRYHKLFEMIAAEAPGGVFLGGDLLAHGLRPDGPEDFVEGFLVRHFAALRATLGPAYPPVFLILGNDDARVHEPAFAAEPHRLWTYLHNRRAELAGRPAFGYACIPPTPFRLKDWERYDVSRYVDPGCVSPEEGYRTVPADEHDVRYGTIEQDLERLVGAADVAEALFLLHAPPHDTALDRAALDNKFVDHVPLDVHVGSIAVRRFIERRQPRLTLHGHIHESTRLTGAWRDRLGRTHCFNAAHDGDELCVVRFDLDDLDTARRELV